MENKIEYAKIEFIESKYNKKIKENELTTYSYISNHLCFEYFVGYEVASLIGYKNPVNTLNNVSKCNQLVFREYPGVKEPELDPRTILINRDGAIELVLKTRKRITPDVLYILKKFNIDTTNMKCLSKEQQTLSTITNTFKTETFEDQYKVGKYYLDLYFPEYKIVIECDENGHADRKPYKERERMDFVNEKLGLEDSNWIRYNPDEKDFDLSKVMGKIYRKINEYKDLNNTKIPEPKFRNNPNKLEAKFERLLSTYLDRVQYRKVTKDAPEGKRWCNGFCQKYKKCEEFIRRSDSLLTFCKECENMADVAEVRIKEGTLTAQEIRKDPSIILLKPGDKICKTCNKVKDKGEFREKRNNCKKCEHLTRMKNVEENFDEEQEVQILKNISKEERDIKIVEYNKDKLHKIAKFCNIHRKSYDTKPKIMEKIISYFDTL
jgi:very-short-patch-repair endonuclease